MEVQCKRWICRAGAAFLFLLQPRHRLRPTRIIYGPMVGLQSRFERAAITLPSYTYMLRCVCEIEVFDGQPVVGRCLK